MAKGASTTPAGHGELLTTPEFEQWAELARENARQAAGWEFELCGVPVSRLRSMARREAVGRARAFSSRMGVAFRDTADEPDLLVMSGHQPEFYHPGVWIKAFLLQRLAEETGAAAVDLVVDSDGFDSIEVHSPCLRPEIRVCRAYLAVGTDDGCYACTPVPPMADIERFCEAASANLETLPAPALRHHFTRFCAALRAAATDARNVGELVTFARRRYEQPAGSDYMELPVTSMAGSRAFATLVAHIALDAERFAMAYNEALAEHRERTGTRSPAQPFPDLAIGPDLIELPLWHIGATRQQIAVVPGPRPRLVAGDVMCELDPDADPVGALMASGLRPAPKAVLLTLFSRVLLADLFIHGVGGGKYDMVTDGLIRRYLRIRPPRFAVASLTMYLPLGARIVSDAEIEAAAMALNRLKHNPDQMLGEAEFESDEEWESATALVREKTGLVEAIRGPGADKKAIGARIREVNELLASIMAPLERQLTDRLDSLRRMREAADILTDRTYPFCFWSALEVADKAR